MAERLNAAVLKTVEGHTSGGSNPSPSATETQGSCDRLPQGLFCAPGRGGGAARGAQAEFTSAVSKPRDVQALRPYSVS